MARPALFSGEGLWFKLRMRCMVDKVVRGLLGLGLLWATTCGGGKGASGSLPAGTAQGGTGATGVGGRAGAAGNATGGSAPTKTSSCVDYVLAACQRIADCSGYQPPLEDCTDQANLCPDLFFSPGSTRTIDSMLTCANAFATESCDDLLRGVYPACATLGTLANGAACMFHSQCASGGCSQHGKGCGTCLAPAAAGASCQSGVNVCPQSYYCGSSNTCTARPSNWTPPTEVVDLTVPLPAGSRCTNYPTPPCAAGLACVDDPNDAGSLGICQTAPGVGQPCAAEPGGQIAVCGNGAYCDSSHVCRTSPSDGQPCVTDSLGDYTCGQTDLLCKGTAPGTCQPWTPLGGACTITPLVLERGDCASGLFCGCAAATCATGTCVDLRQPGESCSDAGSRCTLGSECRSGQCVFTDQVTLFAGACG
jgi:hypothetical protein